MKLVFYVNNPSELSAGIRSFTDMVTVEIESGEPGGEPGEFVAYLTKSLTDWYDGANVTFLPDGKLPEPWEPEYYVDRDPNTGLPPEPVQPAPSESTYFTPKILEELRQREQEMDVRFGLVKIEGTERR